MTTDRPWLQRLGEATDYEQLQEIFAQIADDANGASDPGAQVSDPGKLIASIDHAIHRIEQERSRDNGELEQFESQYAEFKEHQRGMLGWFRRHLPFTKTRRQEIRHRSAVADQHAEILADNLVIARAQMLKQRLLPPDERRFGESAQRWKTRLDECESIQRIEEFGANVGALLDEMSTSAAFVHEIAAEIEAFEKAEFSSKDDQRRQREDVAAARAELSQFEAELGEENSIRDAAIRRAGELARDQLMQSDHEFYRLTNQVEDLRRMKKLADRAAGTAEEFTELIDQIHELNQQLDTCVDEQPRILAERERLRRELESSDRRLQRTAGKLENVTGPFQKAKSAVEKSEAALDAVKRIYDRHQQAGGDSGSDSGDEIKAEYDRLSRQHEQTLREFEVAREPYESLESKHERRRQEARKFREELQSAEQSAEENDKRCESLSSRLRELSDEVPRVLAELEPNLNEFLHDVDSLPFESHVSILNRTLQWRSALRDRASVVVHANAASTPSERDTDQVEKLAEAMRLDERVIQKLLNSSKKECDQRWSQRCLELFGEDLAQRVCGT